MIDGLTGGSNSLTQPSLSDVTTDESRPASFDYITAVFGLGMVIGPTIGALGARA